MTLDASASPSPPLSPASRLEVLKHPMVGTVLALPGCFGSGALLAAFQAPEFLWLMACAMVLYLVWSMTEAIFLANLWLLGLFAFVVGLRPWPAAWQSFSAWTDARLWALVLLALWLSQTLLLLLLAFTAQGWQRRSQWRVKRWFMACFSCIALSAGFWSQL